MAKIKKILKFVSHSFGYLQFLKKLEAEPRVIRYQIPGFANTSGGYHDICIDSSDGVLCLVAYNEVGRGKLVLVDKDSSCYSVLCDCPVNYQIGSRCVILETAEFNAVLSSTINKKYPGRPESSMFDLDGSVLNRFPSDFIDVCETRCEAASVDFRPIWENRKGYGFRRDFSTGSLAVTNLISGQRVLELEIQSDFRFLNPSAMAFLNHIKFSPSGRFIFGFVSEITPRRQNKCWIFDRIRQKFLVHLDWKQFLIVSHHCWLNDFEFLFFAFRKNGSGGYFVLDVRSGVISDFCSTIDVDGHPTRWGNGIITDCYGSVLGAQSIWALRGDDLRLVFSVFTRKGPGEAERCDVHPRVSRSNKSLYFDRFVGFSCLTRELCEISLYD